MIENKSMGQIINLRSNSERRRDLKNEQSLTNPLFLQLNFAIKEVENYFKSLEGKPRLKIFDFGCGQKPYRIFAMDHEYIGIDIDKKNTKADIYADISNVPVDDCQADVIVSFYVLEHVPNPQQVLNEKFRILKEGGQLFMLIPLYWEEHEQPHDFFRFTRFGIRMLLENATFKNIEIKEVNTGYAILGMHLARLADERRYTKMLIPIINYFFNKLEIRSLHRANMRGKEISNVMTFAVRARK